MFTLIIVLVILASLLTIGIVLVQESKGGGLASSFSSSNQVLGVRKTTDFLEKATWGLAAALVVLSVLSTAFVPKAETKTPVNIVPLEQPAATALAVPGAAAPAADAPAAETPAEAPAK